MGPPERKVPGAGRLPGNRNKTPNNDAEGTYAALDCKWDPWIYQYLYYLVDQRRGHRVEPIGEYLVNEALYYFKEFAKTGHPADRFNAWVAIGAACSWCVQIDRKGLS
jgi:hypothetical protein